MEYSGLVAEKFCRHLSPADTESNKMILPQSFTAKYSKRLADNMELRVRNGYVLPVQYDRNRGLVKGILSFFKNFELKGGEILLFEYLGRENINVYIMGITGSEIHYPSILHTLKDWLPPMVTLGAGGLRFICSKDDVNLQLDELSPPAEFLARCESTLSEFITYVISNGKKLCGSYCRHSKKLKGLRSLCSILNVPDFGAYHMFIFTYEPDSGFSISVFDEDLYEIVFPGTPLSIEGSSYFPSAGSYFQITVEEKHISDVCFAVEISNEYRWLCNRWNKSQCIKVYSGDARWMLYIRKRDDYYCHTIEDGWRIFQADMDLEAGDICVFECASHSYDHFSVRVVKNPFKDED